MPHQTYRATKDGLKVGNSIRDYGDLIPEARDWPNRGVWLGEGYIEAYTASDTEWSRHLKKFPMEQNAKGKPGKKIAVKKTASAKRIRIVKKGKNNAGRKLAERSV